ncbi:MAG: NADH-quinone oxidoreductase subunit C [Candidatus Hydrogenedentota bacterium]
MTRIELTKIYSQLSNKFPDAILPFTLPANGDSYIEIKQESILVIASELKNNGFTSLVCMTGVDDGNTFSIRYHLYSMQKKEWAILKLSLSKDNPVVDSVSGIWRAANWQEREIYDMFGIKFIGHPDLRRILMPEDWSGFPLRRDYVTPSRWHGIPV